jgi:hypothetical protein
MLSCSLICPPTLPARARWLAVLSASALVASAATLSDPQVDTYDVRVGTQTFAPKYQFTTNTALVETAEAIQALGSDIFKGYLGKGMSGQYPGVTIPGNVTNLLTLVRDEPSTRRVLDLPFRHLLLWSYCFSASGDAAFTDGFSSTERAKEYAEMFAFSRYLLTNYNSSGKSFYLGHWEGDWYLLPGYNTSVNPSPTAIQGMIDWLNTRQQAVDDAMRTTPHTNVAVYHYTEVNRVRDAMFNGPTNNQRLVNRVLPYLTNLDFVSWSSYDGMNLPTSELHATLDYIEAHLPTNKAPAIAGRRVWIGEYGWGGSNTSEQQEPPTRAYFQKLLPWSPRFILFWEMYDNENKAYWLIDSSGNKTPCWHLHQRFINRARLLTARFREANARLPSDAEFAALLTPLLSQPLPAPVPLALSAQRLLAITSSVATVTGTLEQGVYGDDAARVWVCWGPQDGGTSRTTWAWSRVVGTNAHFNATAFAAQLTNLPPNTNCFFRFCATNATAGEVWATNSIQFHTVGLDPAAFGSRMKITFAGYSRSEPLANFPVLVVLGTQLPGFDYRQFASRTGGDLRFANASGTVPLPHELDEWNTNGLSTVWVQVPSLANSNDSIWAYWGNPLATNLPATSTNGAVWSPDFELVWHLKEPVFPRADSTLKHPATTGVSPGLTAAGAVGRAAVFNGSTMYLDAGTVVLGDPFTLSAWLRLDPTANSIQTLWASKTGGSATDGLALFANSWGTSDRKLLLETGNGTLGAISATATNALPPAAWHHAAAVVDRAAGTGRLFLNGTEVSQTTTVRSDFNPARPLTLGSFAEHIYCFKGQLDEARIATVSRSSNWLWAAWLNIASNSFFNSTAPVLRQQPALTLSRLGGAPVATWPASGVGFALHSTTNLAAPLWTLATNQPVFTNGQWRISLPAAAGVSRFHRLQST